MSVTTTQTTAPTNQPDPAVTPARRVSSDDKPPPPTPLSPPVRSGELLFEVPFATALTDLDLALLARTLDLSLRNPPMTGPRSAARRHDAPGFVRLDHYSGLFLRRGAVEGEWLLQARTWGHPAAQAVHGWHVLAAGAARELDPAVTVPRRLEPDVREIVDRPLGRAANKRLARFRRRLVGLS
jgi:hypothetical protein